jgi:magnesium transporter
MIVDKALFVDGRREPVANPFSAIRRAQTTPGAFLWMDVHEPTLDEFEDIALVFGPHPLAIEDAVNAHQRPKLELYEDSLFMVLKTLRVRQPAGLEAGEVMVFVGDSFVVTVGHGDDSPVDTMRMRMRNRSELLRLGPAMVLHGLCDAVVDTYEVVAAYLEDELEDLETRVFAGDVGEAARIYALKRDVVELRHAVQPLAHPMRVLASAPGMEFPKAARPYFRDVSDHVLRTVDRAEAFDSLLSDILAASLARISVQQNDDMRRMAEQSVQQNEDMRRISAWVALGAVNTIIAGIYGMNFDNMPELHTQYGYFVVLGLMVAIAGVLYWRFKRSGWL